MKGTRLLKSAAVFFAGAMVLSTGCTDYSADIQALDKKLSELTAGKVATLEAQVQGLLATVTTLETIARHEEDIRKVRQQISDLETALKTDYEDKIKAAADALDTALDGKLDKAAFTSAKQEIESGLQGLGDRIKAIEDADFQKQVNDLKDALGTRLGKLEALLAGEWDGKTVKEAIAAVQQSVVDLETSLEGEIGLLRDRMDAAEESIRKINEEVIPAINKAISDLEALKVDKSDYDAYKEATAVTLGLLSDAIDELAVLTAGFPEGRSIKEYIDGILVKLDDYVLTTTFEEFVRIAVTREELNGLSSQLGGRLGALEGLLAGDWGGATVKEYVDKQISAVQARLDQVTNAKGTGRLDVLENVLSQLKNTAATIVSQIQFALDYTGSSGKGLQGYIDDGDAGALKAAKDYTDQQIQSINKRVEELNVGLSGRLDVLENTVSELVGRIRSIVFVPAFDDGKMEVPESGSLVNTFKVMPADAAGDVVALFSSNPDAFSFDVKTVRTRSEGDGVGLTLSVSDVRLNAANAGKGWVDVSVKSNYADLSVSEIAKTYSAALVIGTISSPFCPICPGSGISIHAYVEMGDGLKWATMNIGASKPEEYGGYFAWGETAPKTDYSWETYKWLQNGWTDWMYSLTRYTFSDGTLNAIYYDKSTETFIGDKGDGKAYTDFSSYDYEDDAARKIWRSTWRTPTYEECRALLDRNDFDWTWTDDYNETGVAGMVVTSKVEGFEGNSIFLPATSGSKNVRYFCYWSSSLDHHISFRSWYAVSLGFDHTGSSFIENRLRCLGLPVRPVSE